MRKNSKSVSANGEPAMSSYESQRHLSPQQEAELVDRLRARDRAAQTEVVRRYRRLLLCQVLPVLRDRFLAEDAIQETWIIAFGRIEHFEGRSSLRTWLTGIAINQARRCRRKGKRPFLASALLGRPRASSAGGPATADAHVREPVNKVTAEHMLLEREAVQALWNAVDELPAGQRSVLLLDLRGCSPVETSSTLKITEMARRVRLSRARARLRKVFRWDVRRSA